MIFINNYYHFSVLMFNLISYIFILFNLFLIFFLFDLKYVKTLNDLKLFGNIYFVTIFVVILLLSFAGIPPLLGFISKFLIFLFIVSKNNYLFMFIFIFSNMFIIYFYIQNLRFIITKNIHNNLFIKNNYIKFNFSLVFLINLLNFFNIFFIFFFDEVLIYFNFLSSCYNF